MNNIKIHFSSDTNLKNLSFDISVNKNPLSYTIDNNILNINSDQIVFGINLLKIKLLTPFLGNPIKLDSFYAVKNYSTETGKLIMRDYTKTSQSHGEKKIGSILSMIKMDYLMKLRIKYI